MLKFIKKLFKNKGELKIKRVFDLEEEIYRVPHPTVIYWDIIDTHTDYKLLDGIYKAIINGDELRYFVSGWGLECMLFTRKYGWCKLTVPRDLMFIEFGIYKNSIRYDINYPYELATHPELEKFLTDLVDKALDEFEKDRNLV